MTWETCSTRAPGGSCAKAAKVAAGKATSPADSPGSLQNSLEIDMETMRKRRDRIRRHAERLARQSLAGAGSRRAVAAALGKSESTISHECTTRSNRVLTAAFEILLTLNAHPGTSGRAYADAACEAVDLSEIILVDEAVAIERGLYLLDHENHLDALEDIASLRGTAEHAPACRAHGSALIELASIEDELAMRAVCLHAEYRRRRVS